MFDSEPEKILANILHRGGRLDKDDGILIGLDTYHDKRSAYIFEVTPRGTQDDAHFTNEALTFPDDWAWEGVYESEGRITEQGWELEVAIPLTTIRFEEGVSSMGVAFYRSIRRKNELLCFLVSLVAIFLTAVMWNRPSAGPGQTEYEAAINAFSKAPSSIQNEWTHLRGWLHKAYSLEQRGENELAKQTYVRVREILANTHHVPQNSKLRSQLLAFVTSRIAAI